MGHPRTPPAITPQILLRAYSIGLFPMAEGAEDPSLFVIEGCAAAAPDRPETWINARIRHLYRALFDMGHAHTVEAYQGSELVGGLYGVALGAAFFGESMFHRRTDASKVCLLHLAARLRDGGYGLLDTQFVTPHLQTLGAVEVPRARYRKRLAEAVRRRGRPEAWSKLPLSGTRVLEILAAEPA